MAVLSMIRIQSIIYTFWMAGFLNLMVLTMHGQVTNHLNDFGELNSNEKIQFDLGLPYNPRQAMDTSSDANTPLLLLLKLK